MKSTITHVRAKEESISLLICTLVIVIALMPLLAFTTYFRYYDLLIFLASYSLRVFTLTAGYHRYFSHKSFKTSRLFQFILAFISATALQGGALWWASRHRHHHLYSDQPEDAHSPKQQGFWYSHCIWFMYHKNLKARYDLIRDFASFPELRFLEKYWYLSPLAMILILALIGGWNAVVWGFFVPAVFVNHITYCVNSVVHIFGKRRYNTTDTSRNNWLISLLAFGEGWHNNHHRYAGSASQGFAWYELDITYCLLKMLSWLRIVWDLKPIPDAILREGHLKTKSGNPIIENYQQLAREKEAHTNSLDTHSEMVSTGSNTHG